MKKAVAFIVLLCPLIGNIYAQTNTFPSSGNVGIGTTSPGIRLHIKPDGSTPAWIALDKNAGMESGIRFLKGGGPTLFYFYSDNDDNDALKIQSPAVSGENDGAPRIQIPYDNKHLYLTTSGGNVAIGHKAPTYKLDVLAPENTWKARFQGPDGYITMGPANPSWAHIYTDRPNFIFNQNLWSITGGFSSYNSTDLVLQTNGNTRVTVSNATGNVGIGTSSPNERLTVNGRIYGKEVKVDLSVPGPDYVFEKDYDLLSLDEVKFYVAHYKRLPEVPSAAEMEQEGIQLGKMNMLLLKKIEELTLYMIDMNETVKRLEAVNETQKTEIEKLQQIVNSSEKK